MADYWKSQPKKFCQYCKCWIADNKPSIEFHERGKNHKQNVANKIEEIKKSSVAKAKKEEKMSKEFAAMEEAALKAYEEDMKRLQAESVGSEVSSASQAVSVQAPKKAKKHKAVVTTRHFSKKEPNVWLMGTTDDGQTYFYNSVTGESQWDKPEGFTDESVPSTDQTGQGSSASAWMEAVSPDGYTYYYNTETGESTWEKPPDFPSKEESPAEKNEEDEVHSTPEPEPLSEGEDTNKAPKEAADQEEPKQTRGPKINFRKRKEEATPLLEKDDKETKVEEKVEQVTKTEEVEEVAEETKTDELTEEVKEEGKAESSRPAEENKIPAKKPRKTNPYGEWEQIQALDDPYENVDWQLPDTEMLSYTTPDLPPEPKPKFKERTITSLGDESNAGATFKRRKTENGKSRSLRQREKDD